MEARKVFWTGGWDSTYRLLSLVLDHKVDVQPLYVLDLDRKSYAHELRAMADIRAGIEVFAGRRGRLHLTRVYLKHEIAENEDITRLFAELADQVHVGSQYEWLARLCEQEQLTGVELSLTGHEVGTDLQNRMFVEPRSGDFQLRTDEEVRRLFSFYSFPLLQTTKEDMRVGAEEKGFMNLLEKSWFCHHPILGSPCGYCQPCRFSREAGRSIRYSRAGWFVDLGRRLKRAVR